MKRISIFIFTIIILLFSINKVYAFDEYNLQLTSGGTLYAFNAVSGSQLTTSQRNAIVDYDQSNSKITLHEGVHYNLIYSQKNMNITSNKKDTFVNIIHSTGNTTLNELYFEAYDTQDTEVHFTRSGNQVYVSLSFETDLTITDCKLKSHLLKGSESYIEAYGLLTIDNSDITEQIIYGFGSGSTITDSDLKIFGLSSRNGLNVENTKLNSLDGFTDDSLLQSFVSSSSGNVTLTDCDFKFNGFISSGGTLTLNNTTIIKDDNYKMTATQSKANNLILNNSTLKSFSRMIIKNDLELNDSTYEIDAKEHPVYLENHNIDITATSALVVVNNFKSTNSSFKVKQVGSVPAFLIGGEFITDIDSLGFVDYDGNILDLELVNIEDYGFFNNPYNSAVYTNELALPSTFRDAYTLLLNGEATYSLEPKSIDTYTFRVINGTWDDDTTEPLIKRIVRGTTIDSNLIKTKANESNMELVITKTGEKEYTYEYKKKIEVNVDNPKTGVKDLFILVIISLIGLAYFFINKNKFTLFKNI